MNAIDFRQSRSLLRLPQAIIASKLFSIDGTFALKWVNINAASWVEKKRKNSTGNSYMPKIQAEKGDFLKIFIALDFYLC